MCACTLTKEKSKPILWFYTRCCCQPWARPSPQGFSTTAVALCTAVKGSQQVLFKKFLKSNDIIKEKCKLQVYFLSYLTATYSRSANKASPVAPALSITWDSAEPGFRARPLVSLVTGRQLIKHRGCLHLATCHPQHNKYVVITQNQSATRNPLLRELNNNLLNK